jgi:hypothetical protein
VFTAAKSIVEASPLSAGSAACSNSKIEFPELGQTAIASDYAGANPNIAVFDELWAFTSVPCSASRVLTTLN